ncbi:LamG-like jellyroll fold domain-containing protein [Streptomyces sp. NPDC048232]|uniref:LamG-like jellyroll fold domain-containing protein n=1 Tax=Streptomyces sp. NPDC048232 TaxID=3365520 RepID=UPI003719C518
MAVGLVSALPGDVAAAEPTASPPSSAAEGRSLTESEAVAEAERIGKPVEVLGQRGESREVFATPEGDLEAREYLRPVWARSQNGWQRVDTALAPTADGGVAPKAATVDLAFSGGGTEPLVRMQRAGRELSLSWPTSLPEPQLNGAVATYPSVLPDVDLRMTAQEDGFTQLLVVKTAEAAASDQLAELRLKLAADGLDVKESAEGGLQALDEGAGGAVFEAPKPMMWDSSSGAASAGAKSSPTTAAGRGATVAVQTAEGAAEPGAGESGKLAPVDVEVAAGQDELVLRPDAEVLKGEDTTYPVFIDPQWYTPQASAWTMASKYWASSPQWKFNGDSDSGLGYCNWSYCKPHDTKRLFYRLPVSKFAGKTILSAEFVVRNTWSASCSARTVELWQTKDISSSTTWNSQNASGFWVKEAASDSFAYGYTGCAAADAEFNVKTAVQAAANSRKSTMTFGLRAGSESDGYGWKRFSDKAYLRVKFNRAPSQIKMSQLTMEYGGTCKYSPAPRIRSLGKVYANNVTDPDGDSVAVQFQAKWDSGDGKGLVARWKPALSSAKRSGSDFAISLPTSTPQNRTVHWYARTWDGAQYSPWSTDGSPTGCYFTYDTKVPKAPAISSGEYPASNPENPSDPWYDGVGKYGDFELKAADTDVTRYWFGINQNPTSKHAVTTSGGAARVMKMLPAKPGLNFVTAQAFDQAGNGSEIRTYQFRVKAGQPERGMWQMDDATGSTAAKGTAPDRTAELRGGAMAGTEGTKGSAVSFDGVDDYAVTDIPTVDTSTGFAVSAWAKLSELPGQAAIVAAQPGNESPGFELYYSQAYDRWAFNQYKSDTQSAGLVRVMQPAAGGAQAGQWTHLVGTYNADTDQLQLYVNGSLAGTTAYDTPWDARRGLQIGAGSYHGAPDCFFPGTIDEVQVFDRPLTYTEVTRLHRKETSTTGRPARAVFPMDEPATATQLTGRADVLDARLSGGVTTGQPGIAGKALTLNGADGFASTGRPVLDSRRSFAISAWAKLPATKPGQAAIVATQAGAQRPGMELYYSPSYDRWVVNQYASDAAGAAVTRAMQPEGTKSYANTWTHLVGVHDTVANKLILYVNGTKAGEAVLQAGWSAGGPFQIGAGSYGGAPDTFFPGQIDDVRVFDRPVSEEEIHQLFRQRPLVSGRWTFAQASGTPRTTPDASASGNEMTLKGEAQIGSGYVDGGVSFDGIDDYGQTSSVPIDTSSSFTVTSWAQTAAVPDHDVTLLSIPGTAQDALAVRYQPSATPESDPGRWRIAMAASDTSNAAVTDVDNGQFFAPTDWTHLALVYDGFAKQLSLYVNGELEEVACADADGDGDADDPSCTGRLSFAEDVLSFKATQPMQLGRSQIGTSAGDEYWPGTVSDLWTFQGTLTEAQIRLLAVGNPGMPTEVPNNV